MRTLFMMEGITVQHAGELLFDASATRHQRAKCEGTYLRSLEDVVFALVFGSGFAVSGNLPKVGDETPGADLCCSFQDAVHTIDSSSGTPDSLIESQSGRAAVAGWIAGLAHLKNSFLPYWQEFIVREAEASLRPRFGSDTDREKAEWEYLRRPDADRLRMTFGKNYFNAPELHEALSETFVSQLGEEVASVQRVPKRTAEEFVRRAVVAHAVIFEWYGRRLQEGTGPELPLSHLPHVTRTTFFAEEEVEHKLWQLGRLIMPRVLVEILKPCASRAEVLSVIGDRMTEGLLTPLRNRFREAVEVLDIQELEKIRIDIEQMMTTDDEPSSIQVAMKAGFVGPIPRVEVEIGKRRTVEDSDYKSAIRWLLRRTPDTRDELRVQAHRLFPELSDPWR